MERVKKLRQLCSITRTDDEDLISYLREFEAIYITIAEYFSNRELFLLLLQGLPVEMALELCWENKWEMGKVDDFQLVLAEVRQVIRSHATFRLDRGLPVYEPYQQAADVHNVLHNVLQEIKYRRNGDVVEALAIVIDGLNLEPEQLERLEKMIQPGDDGPFINAS